MTCKPLPATRQACRELLGKEKDSASSGDEALMRPLPGYVHSRVALAATATPRLLPAIMAITDQRQARCHGAVAGFDGDSGLKRRQARSPCRPRSTTKGDYIQVSGQELAEHVYNGHACINALYVLLYISLSTIFYRVSGTRQTPGKSCTRKTWASSFT